MEVKHTQMTWSRAEGTSQLYEQDDAYGIHCPALTSAQPKAMWIILCYHRIIKEKNIPSLVFQMGGVHSHITHYDSSKKWTLAALQPHT